MKQYIRAFLMLVFVLLVVLFIEAPRVTRLVSQDSFFDKFGGGYLAFASNIMERLSFSRVTVIDPNAPASPAEAPTEAGPKFTAPEPPYSILMMGDSFIAERFGVQMERELEAYASTTVTRRGVYSTGLSRPDYFNWNTELQKLMTAESPNVAVVMYGANDAQDIRNLEGRIILSYGTPEWDTEYLARIRAFLAPLAANETMVFWVGNPVARDAYYRDRMEHLNRLYAEAAAGYPNVRFISTWNLLRDQNGNYSAYLPNSAGQMRLARASDGIHVTDFGAQFLVDAVLSALKQELDLQTPPAATEPTVP